MTVLSLGVSHQTAPVEMRERLAYSADDATATLARVAADGLPGMTDVRELAILSTCNRVELYAVCPPESSVSLADAHRALARLLVARDGVTVDAVWALAQRHAGRPATEHLCRVASGLESMVVGESEILGQVAHASALAAAHGASGRTLRSLFDTAVRCGRRSRAETAIARSPASVSSVAVELARELRPTLAGNRVLIIGAGKMGGIAAKALGERGGWELTVASRTLRSAAGVADESGGDAIDAAELPAAIGRADIVITSASTGRPIVDASTIARAMHDRSDRPLVLIDVALPRNVDPGARAVPSVRLFDLDDLRARIAHAMASRLREAPRVEAIIADELQRLELRLESARRFDPQRVGGE